MVSDPRFRPTRYPGVVRTRPTSWPLQVTHPNADDAAARAEGWQLAARDAAAQRVNANPRQHRPRLRTAERVPRLVGRLIRPDQIESPEAGVPL